MNDNKVDKGFELNYWKLSYRRKFLRTIYLGLPLCILVLFLLPKMYENKYDAIIFNILIIGTEIIQLIYTYYKWKKEVKNK